MQSCIGRVNVPLCCSLIEWSSWYGCPRMYNNPNKSGRDTFKCPQGLRAVAFTCRSELFHLEWQLLGSESRKASAMLSGGSGQCKGAEWVLHQCKGIYWVAILYLACRQLRFSLCSGAVTKTLTVVVFLYYPLSLALWNILCLMPLAQSPAVLSGDVPLVSCLSCCILLRGALLVQGFWLLQPLLSRVCLHCTLGQPVLGYVHCGIVCLASQTSNWVNAFWDGLSGL